MRNRLFLLTWLVSFGSILQAQDIILTVSGESIEAKIIEISDVDVTYKKTANPTGPSYKTQIVNIKSITYENGFVEVYKEDVPEPTTVAPVIEEPAKVTESPPPPPPPVEEITDPEPIKEIKPRARKMVYIPSRGAAFSFYVFNVTKNIESKFHPGMFFGFRSELFFLANTVGDADASNLDGQSLSGSFVYTPAGGEPAMTRNSFTVGNIINLSEHWLYAYVGMGFGAVLQYELHDKWSGSTGDWTYREKAWLINSKESVIGLETEMGLMFDFGPVLTAGVTATNFQKAAWTLGIGFSF